MNETETWTLGIVCVICIMIFLTSVYILHQDKQDLEDLIKGHYKCDSRPSGDRVYACNGGLSNDQGDWCYSTKRKNLHVVCQSGWELI